MLVEARHLIEQEIYLEELVRWSLAHSLPGYGLVPVRPGAPDPLQIEMEGGESQVFVRVRRCVAILPSGCPVYVNAGEEIGRGGTPPVEGSFPFQAGPRQAWTLCLEATPAAKLEVGRIEDEVEPPRTAYRAPEYRLAAVKEETPPNPWRLPLAEVEVEGRRASLRETYIPPCLSTESHPALRAATRRLLQMMQQLGETAASIATAEAAGTDGAKLPGLHPRARFMRDLALRAAVESSTLRDAGVPLGPAQVTAAVRRLLRCARLLLDLQPEVVRGSWQQYLDQAPMGVRDHAVFSARLNEALAVEHRPDRLREEFKAIAEFLQILAGFAEWMRGGPQVPEGDLDYHGRRFGRLRWSHLEIVADGPFYRATISGFDPARYGQILAWIRLPARAGGGDAAADVRTQARRIRLGPNDVKGYWAMDEVPVDMVYDPKAAVIVMVNRNQDAVASLNVVAPSAFDLGRLSQSPNEDIRLYTSL